MTEMRIVVGSGPSSAGIVYALLQRGLPVTVLDAGDTLEPERAKVVEAMALQEPDDWSNADRAAICRMQFENGDGAHPKLAFGSSFAYFFDPKMVTPPGVRLFSSHALGGLSNVWGCALMAATREELSGWPPTVIDGVMAAYPKVVPMLQLSAGTRFLLENSDDDDLPISPAAASILRRFRQSSGGDHAVKIYPTPLAIAQECKACNGCMFGCVYGYTYNSRSAIENLFSRNSGFRYLDGWIVTRYVATKDGVEIHAEEKATKRSRAFLAKQLFLAAGMMATLKIIWNSSPDISQVVHAKDSSYFIVPGFSAPWHPPGSGKHHGLSHLSMEYRGEPFFDKPAYYQMYFNNPVVLEGLKSRLTFLRLAPFHSLAVFANKYAVMCQGYLHSDYCHRLTLAHDQTDGMVRVSIDHNPCTQSLIDEAISTLAAQMRNFGVLFLKRFAEIIPYGASKSGGALPHSSAPRPDATDVLGRPFNTENVFVVDATVMPAMPSGNNTLTLIANAMRIGQIAYAFQHVCADQPPQPDRQSRRRSLRSVFKKIEPAVLVWPDSAFAKRLDQQLEELALPDDRRGRGKIQHAVGANLRLSDDRLLQCQ